MRRKDVVRISADLIRLPYKFVVSAHRGARHHALFDQVKHCCIFIGYPRSGHTLIGALLDAHRDMVLAHELSLMKYVRLGFSRDQLYQLLLDRSAWFARRDCRWSTYSYLVPGQWQGRYRNLTVIGDKKAMGTTLWLGNKPQLLDRLRAVAAVPVKVINVIRNPFDNIATIYTKRQGGMSSLDASIDLYLKLCTSVQKIRTQIPEDDLVDLRHDDVIADPRGKLTTLCRFLDVDTPEDYLTACADLVFESPRKTRHSIEWSPDQIRRVEDCIARFAHLRGYVFEE